jgi:uncharacterized membrane protein YfcA
MIVELVLIVIVMLLILMTAFMFAPLGLGGGVLYVPIFIYLLEWDIKLSLVCSLLLVWTVSMGSRAAHESGGYSEAGVGRKGTPAALCGAIVGALIAALLIDHLGDMSIKIGASILLVWVLYRTVKQLNVEMNGKSNGDDEPPPVQGTLLTKYRAGCFSGGAASGLLGIGGGAVFMTLHRSVLGFKQHQAAGTSYIIESWMVPVGVATHLVVDGTGPLIFETLGLSIIPIYLSVVGTAWLGAKTAIKLLPQRVLTYPFIIAVVASLLRYLIDIREVFFL